MKRAENNKAFFLDFIRNLNSQSRTERDISQFIDDPLLIRTMILLEETLPDFQVLVDELTAEKNRLIVQARVKGRLPSNLKNITISFVMDCQIQHNKIIHHWFMANELSLMQQIDQLSHNMPEKTNENP